MLAFLCEGGWCKPKVIVKLITDISDFNQNKNGRIKYWDVIES